MKVGIYTYIYTLGSTNPPQASADFSRPDPSRSISSSCSLNESKCLSLSTNCNSLINAIYSDEQVHNDSHANKVEVGFQISGVSVFSNDLSFFLPSFLG